MYYPCVCKYRNNNDKKQNNNKSRVIADVLCDDFLCVMRDVLCAVRRFPMRYATISYASCAMCYVLCDDFLCVMRDVLYAMLNRNTSLEPRGIYWF